MRAARPAAVVRGFGAAALVGLLLVALPAAGQDDARAALERAGCEMCHGPGGNGDGPGPVLVPLPYDLPQLTAIVRQGIGHMPAMSRAEVSDADLALVFAFLNRKEGVRLNPDAARAAEAGGGLKPDFAGSAKSGFGRPALDAMRGRIEAARRANDLDALAAIADEARRLTDWAAIAAASATFETIAQAAAAPADAGARIDTAIRRIDHLPATADTHAFRASMYALRLALKGEPDAGLAAEIAAEMREAQQLAPDSGRVVFLTGVAGALAPGAPGGLEAAERQLRRAQQLLASSEPAGDDPWPAWNDADASAWLGRLLAQRGDGVGARRAYQRALEIAPQFLWVTRVLLPALR
ncbi:MAG: c-type cytochrome [Acidobacteria bacterium]|nr:c-type cytochrome [Acidobacteriota bacterium]